MRGLSARTERARRTARDLEQLLVPEGHELAQDVVREARAHREDRTVAGGHGCGDDRDEHPRAEEGGHRVEGLGARLEAGRTVEVDEVVACRDSRGPGGGEAELELVTVGTEGKVEVSLSR